MSGKSASRVPKRRSEVSFSLAKLRTDVAARLGWAPQIAFGLGLVLGFAFSPAFDGAHPPDRLNAAFAAVAALLGGAGLTLLFLQRRSDNSGAFKFLGIPTVAYVIGGIAASLLALLPLHDTYYRYLFAVVAATVLAFLTTIGLVAVSALLAGRENASSAALDTVAKAQKAAKKARR